jgi:Xaa-Pro aminopeptidase
LVLIVASVLVLHAMPPAGSLLGQSLAEFADRRTKLRAAVGDGVVLLVPDRTSDDRSRFRMSNEMVYLTGVETAGATLALLPEGDPLGHTAILFVPGRSSLEAERARTGIETVYEARSLWDTLRPSLERAGVVHIIGPVGERGRYGWSGSVEQRIRAIKPDVEVRDIRPALAALRAVKSPGELANIREAIAATVQGFRLAARAIKPGATELALEGAVLAGFRQAGAAREGFPAVIGSGPNAVILHNDPTSRPLQRDEAVVVDIGAEANYYSADLTRTFPSGGRFTARQTALYELVRSVQTACERAIVPGKTTWSDLDRIARDEFRKSPLRAEGSDGKLLTMDRFFVHGIGHSLGMDVHDPGMFGTIPVGGVITIEPGVYIASENIGIRIEDDYLITETGVEKLSAALPSDIPGIQRMMRAR